MVSEAEWQQKMVVDFLLREEEKEGKNFLFLTKHFTKDKLYLKKFLKPDFIRLFYWNKLLFRFSHSRVELEKISSFTDLDKSLFSINSPISKSPRGNG